jgi:hypothetical protein
LLGIGSLGVGEALELPCTLQTSGEFWNFVPLDTIDLKAFELHCNMQTSGLGSFITNNWEF